jgi:putative protease
MKIMVPVSKIDQIYEYCQAGADEFYFGFWDEKWYRKFGIFEEINRMSSFGSVANFDLRQIVEVVSIIKDNGKKAYLTLNTPIFSNAQYHYIKYLTYQSFFGQLDGLIIGDPSIIDMIKGTGVPIVLSTIAGTYNSLIVRFYEKMNIRRMILPRDMQIQDIQKIVKKFPKIEFEVFLMRNGCKYSDAHCMSFHGRKQGSMCACYDKSLLEFRFCDKYSDEFYKEVYSNNKLFTKAFHKEACGLCSIAVFYNMGIKSLKVVGRADNPEMVKQDIIHVKRIIDALNERKSSIESLYDYNNCLYGLNCYYH